MTESPTILMPRRPGTPLYPKTPPRVPLIDVAIAVVLSFVLGCAATSYIDANVYNRARADLARANAALEEARGLHAECEALLSGREEVTE